MHNLADPKTSMYWSCHLLQETQIEWDSGNFGKYEIDVLYGFCSLHPLFLWGNLIVNVQASDADLQAFWIARSNACGTTTRLHLHTKIVPMLSQARLSRSSSFSHPWQNRSPRMYRLSSIPAALLAAAFSAFSSAVSPPCPLMTH